jgi:hypothetical protein
MPPFLPSQWNQLKLVITQGGFRVPDFLMYVELSEPLIEYTLNRNWRFVVSGEAHKLFITYCPGDDRHETKDGPFTFDQALDECGMWLANIRREQRARDEGGVDAEPSWLRGQMPESYQRSLAEIERLTNEAQRMASVGRLLWQTGEPLNEAVCEVFRRLGFRAELTPRATTYDVTVNIDDKRRLLLEVTGIEGAIQKKSPKLAQVFQTVQEFATEHDRVVLVANTFRQVNVVERDKNSSVTADALKLLQRMTANVVTSPTLFRVWSIALDDPGTAKQQVERLWSQDGGLFELPPIVPG